MISFEIKRELENKFNKMIQRLDRIIQLLEKIAQEDKLEK